MAARGAIVAAAAGALLAAGAGVAAGSVWIADGVTAPSVKVDAKGNAEVDWTAGGAKRSQLVPRTGQVLPGGHVAQDVSKPASAPGVPFVALARRTPDGTIWALQVEGSHLRLANWQGEPTKLELSLTGRRLAGRVTFHGRPVTGFSPTPAGRRQRIYVYLECSGCPAGGGGWGQMLGVAPRADGSFEVYLRPSWLGRRYRATVAGPNLGTVRAPDAQTIIPG